MEDPTPLPRSTSPPLSLESKLHSTTRIPETPMRTSSTPRSTTPRNRSRPRLPAGPRSRTQSRYKDDSHDMAAPPPSRSHRASGEAVAPESSPGGTQMIRWSSTSSSLGSAADSASQHGSITARSRPVSEMQSPPAYSTSGSSSPLPPSTSPHPSIQTPQYAPTSSQSASPNDDGENRMVLSRVRSNGQLSLVAEQSQLEAPPHLQSQQTSTPPPTPPASSSLSVASPSLLPSNSPTLSFTTATAAPTTSSTPKPVLKHTPQPTPPPVSFDPPPLPNSAEYKPLTLDAAQWTLSSAELQGIVSSVIRESAHERFVRLLRPGVVGDLAEIDPEREDSEGQALLERDLAQVERTRREALAKWRFEYGRRKMVLQSLFALAAADVGDGTGTPASVGGGGGGGLNASVLQTLLNQLAQSTTAMDALAATLVHAGAHAAQLTQLRDTHRASALAVALRKLNASYARRTRDLVSEKEKRATVESEVEEAWRIAEDVAAEVDRLRDVVEGLEGRLRAQEEGRVEAGMQTEVEEVAEVEELPVILEPAEEVSWGGAQGKGSTEEDGSWEDATVDGFSLMEDATMTSVNRAQVIDVMGIAIATQARLTTVDDEGAAAAVDDAEAATEAQKEEPKEDEVKEEPKEEGVKGETVDEAEAVEEAEVVGEAEAAGADQEEVEEVATPVDKGKGKEKEPTSDEHDNRPFRAGHTRSASVTTTTSLSRRLSSASQVSRVSAARKRSMRTSKASLRMPREWLATPSSPQGDTRSRRARSRSRRRSMSLERSRPPMPELPANIQDMREDVKPDDASFLNMNAEAGKGAGEDAGGDQEVIAPPLSPTYSYSAGFAPRKRPRSPTSPNILSRFAGASGPKLAPVTLTARYPDDPESINSPTFSTSSATSQSASHIFPHATLAAGPSRRPHPKAKTGSEPNIQLTFSALPGLSEDGVYERRGGSLDDRSRPRTVHLKKTSGLKRRMSDLLRFGKARRRSVPVASALGSSALTRS